MLIEFDKKNQSKKNKLKKRLQPIVQWSHISLIT